MTEKLQQAMLESFPLDFTRILVVGVSGGPDSLCLLDALHRAGLRGVVAHMNHRLRPEADQEAEHVRQVAERYGVPYVLKVEDVAAYAEGHALSVEEAARVLRYRFLFAEAVRWEAQAVAVGHTADDQVETVLMHLLRGAGLEGLKGMEAWHLPNAWSQEIPLVRPLLGMWREETVAYCQERGLQPVMDGSNLETTYFRNRLRHELIPALQAYNPRLKENLVRMAEVLRGDQQVLEQILETAWQACARQAGPGCVAFSRGALEAQPVGIRRRLVRKAIGAQRPGLRDIGFETVERALEFLRQPAPRGQIDLAAGLRMLVEEDLVWIATWEADLPGMGWPQVQRGGEPRRLAASGTVLLCQGWQLSLEEAEDVEEGRKQAFENDDPYQAWLDADQIPGALEVRGRREGDRCRPLGMEGHSVKLADLMINVKMPRRARAGWPLACCGGEVVWVPGYATSHTCRVRAETRRIFHLWLIRKT